MLTQFWTAREFLIDRQHRLGVGYIDNIWFERDLERRAALPADQCATVSLAKWPCRVYEKSWPEKAWEKGLLELPPVVVRLEDRR